MKPAPFSYRRAETAGDKLNELFDLRRVAYVAAVGEDLTADAFEFAFGE